MTSPFFSICIPQYCRTDFLLEAITTLFDQQFRDFELCISDDNSPDGRQNEILARLQRSGLAHTLEIQKENRRYDSNMRAAIGLAHGEYCFLLGNDDALVDHYALGRIRHLILEHGPCGVVVPDFQDYRTGAKAYRVHSTGNKGSGPYVAARHFRNFSFVSGIVLERRLAQAFATDRWDGSEMYQTYLACRIIASGKSLIELAEPIVRKDIYLPNLSVESYATRARERRWPVVEINIPLADLGRLTADAISPYVTGATRQCQNAFILKQLLSFTYPFWLIEYRRVQSWFYSVGVMLGMRPNRIAAGIDLSTRDWLLVRVYYAVASIVGLVTPQSLFRRARPLLYRLAKRG